MEVYRCKSGEVFLDSGIIISTLTLGYPYHISGRYIYGFFWLSRNGLKVTQVHWTNSEITKAAVVSLDVRHRVAL